MKINHVWFRLVDSKSLAVANTTETSIPVVAREKIEGLLKRVKAKCSTLLSSIDASQLRVFRSVETLRNKEEALLAQDLVQLYDIEEEESEPLAVVSSDLATWTYYSGDSELMDKLFKPNDATLCTQFKSCVMERILRPVTFDLTTDASAIWLICNLMEFVFQGKFVISRYWTHSSSDSLRWPSFLLSRRELNVLRGEEVACNEDMEMARQRLCKQMMWVFGDQVPYLFGFVASPRKVDLYALVPCSQFKGEVASIPIISFRISEWIGKFGLMLAMLNIGQLFTSLAVLCLHSALEEYTGFKREDDVILIMTPKYVVRDYSKTNLFQPAAKRLEEVHKILVSHRVPHVEILLKTKKSIQLVAFSPRGDAVRPRDLLELFDILAYVLEMLVALHNAGWTHNCIRWYSIWKHPQAKNPTMKSWFVTNFGFAAPSPQEILEDRRRVWGEDPPELFISKGQSMYDCCGSMVFGSVDSQQ